uniref:Uncharacterized protein n=1 Tax=Romanomermis culicivorax TaxID=13658 RepID=A0A915J6C2_ROMCU
TDDASVQHILHHSSISPSLADGGFSSGADFCFLFGEASFCPTLLSRVLSSAMLAANSARWVANSALSTAANSADCPPSELTPALSLDLARMGFSCCS